MLGSRRWIAVGGSLLSAALVLAPGEARADESAPPPSSEVQIESGGMRSPGAFGVGVVLAILGGGGLGAGGYYFGQGAGSCDGIDRSTIPSQAQIDTCTTGTIQQVGGVVGLVAGGAFALAGIPLMIAGGIPKDDKTPPPPQVTVTASSGGGTLTVTF